MLKNLLAHVSATNHKWMRYHSAGISLVAVLNHLLASVQILASGRLQ
jgi:hypothetical protein